MRFIPIILMCACAPNVSEDSWGTSTMPAQAIKFNAMYNSRVAFNHNDFISAGQDAFRDTCVNEIEWIYDIENSVIINQDDTVSWKGVMGDDPVIEAAGYPVLEGQWDALISLEGTNCYTSMSVIGMSKDSGSSRTEEW